MDTKSIMKLIPKDKFDTSTISQLMEIDGDDIQPILPQLLEWIADMNWPVAKEMVEVLARFPDLMIPLLFESLSEKGSDDILKYWIITELIPKFPRGTQETLLSSIKRIYERPTNSEKLEEVDEQAQIFLVEYSYASQ